MLNSYDCFLNQLCVAQEVYEKDLRLHALSGEPSSGARHRQHRHEHGGGRARPVKNRGTCESIESICKNLGVQQLKL